MSHYHDTSFANQNKQLPLISILWTIWHNAMKHPPMQGTFFLIATTTLRNCYRCIRTNSAQSSERKKNAAFNEFASATQQNIFYINNNNKSMQIFINIYAKCECCAVLFSLKFSISNMQRMVFVLKFISCHGNGHVHIPFRYVERLYAEIYEF